MSVQGTNFVLRRSGNLGLKITARVIEYLSGSGAIQQLHTAFGVLSFPEFANREERLFSFPKFPVVSSKSWRVRSRYRYLT